MVVLYVLFCPKRKKEKKINKFTIVMLNMKIPTASFRISNVRSLTGQINLDYCIYSGTLHHYIMADRCLYVFFSFYVCACASSVAPPPPRKRGLYDHAL